MKTKIWNELSLLIEEITDTHINQTKTRPQVSLQLKFSKSMDTFSLNIQLELEEGNGR